MDHKQQQTKPIHPQTKANRFSKMTFWWLKKLYKDGLRRPLTDDDVYENLKDHDSHDIAEKFTMIWDEELKRKDPSVIRMFYKAYGFPVMIVGLTFSIIETLNRCAQPLFLGALLSYFVDPTITKETAYLYAVGIVACSLIPVLTFHPFMYFIMEQGMKLRIGSSRLVYDKVSNLSISFNLLGILIKLRHRSTDSSNDKISASRWTSWSRDQFVVQRFCKIRYCIVFPARSLERTS